MMPADGSRQERIAAAFDAVVEREGDARRAAIDTLDPEIRAEVESLIAALERNSAYLEAGPHDANRPPMPAERIGSYRLLRLVGRGGMGAVYEAERADATFVKRVAIKLIREDVSGEAVAKRFARERSILAALEHPNIARMLDGGTLASGREYFVMEFVDGIPITDYCDEHRAPIRR